MKKLIVSSLALIISTVTVASAITVNDGKTSPSSCNNAESHDYYYYFQSNNNKLTYNNINDTYWDQVNAFIRNDSSVEIYRNGIISQCSNWERVSNIVRGGGDVRNQYPATVLRNNDGCVFNKPTYIKDENNPAAIDAQIHFTIGVNVLANSKGNGHDKINEGKFYYKSGSSFYCYPTWEQKSSNSECAKASSYYWEEADLHTGECLNYRVFRCGDGLVNGRNKNGTTITNYNNTSYTEQCDPNHPDWKNGKAGQTCNPNTCQIEYTIAECGNLNSDNPVYNSNYPTPRIVNSTPGLCGVGTLSGNVSYDKDAGKYTWKCVNGNSQPVVCEAKDLWCGDGNLQENKGEECDEGKNNGKSGFSCASDCKKVPQCNSQYNGKNIYTSNSSSVIDSYVDKSKLCEIGTMFPSTFSPNQWTVGNPRIHYWGCKNGEKTISDKACQLNQYRCGDGIKNGGNQKLFINDRTIEACDPESSEWKNRTDGQVCNSSCGFDDAKCGPMDREPEMGKYNSYHPNPRVTENSGGLCDLGKVINFKYDSETGKYTWDCQNGTSSNDFCDAQDLRCGDSKVTDGEQCDPKDTRDPKVKGWGPGTWKDCKSCKIEPIPQVGPVCNSAFSGQTNYTKNSSTDWLNKDSGLCTRGKVIYFNSEWSTGSQRKFTWKCSNDDLDITCTAKQEWCGDGIRNNDEACDRNDKSHTNWGNGCSRECKQTYNPGVCGSKYNQQKYYMTGGYEHLKETTNGLCNAGDVTGFANHYPNPNSHTYTWQCKTESGDYSPLCRADLEWCGDGTVQKNQGETCDLGENNGKPGSACSKYCKAVNDLKCGAGSGTTKYFSGGRQTNPWLTNNEMCSGSSVSVVNVDKTTNGDGHMSWTCENENGTQKTCEAYQKWCGDGVKNYGELCDPNDTKNEAGWGNDGCSLSCQPMNVAPSECDENSTFHYVLRSGYQYTFYDRFLPGGTRYLYDFDVNFVEKKPYDYNRGENPTFSWTENLVNGVYMVVSSEKRVLKSSPLYKIRDHPAFGDSTKDDIYIEYTIKYSDRAYSTKPSDSQLKSHKECAYYKITRCGDGNLDEDWEGRCDKNGNCKDPEMCDPGSAGTAILPNGQICNSECKTETPAVPVCSSIYNGKVIDYDLTGGNHLCSVGTYTTGSLHFDEATNTWTWKCDNVAGVEKECSATKKVAPKGTPEIEKTLQNKVEVKEVGQKLDWEVRVTAKGGDITDFEIWDVMPKELNYLDWDYKDGKKPEGLTVTKQDRTGTSGDSTVYYWDVEGTLKEGNSLTIVVKSEVKEMPASGANILNIACVDDDGKVICDPEPVPAVCNSVYSGQTVKDLKETDGLCIIGKVTGFKFDEKTNKWTWGCNNEESTVNCWAKKEEVAGNWKMKKELITKGEVNSGDILDWKITVWAEGGNVKNLDITDSMPTILSYVRKSVKISKNPDDIKITKETVTNSGNGVDNEVLFNTQGILHDGNSIILTLKTKVLSMPEPGVEYKNVACSKPEDEPEWKCDDEPIPAVCNSAYSGQIVKDLKETDELCSVGKVTEFKFNEKTNKWTWKCDNEESTVSCWASKKTSKGRLDPLKTLIGSKEIKQTGDKVEWSLKVTAVGGDVTNFVMEDELPRVLGYQDYEVLYASGVTVKSPTTGTVITGGKEAETIEWKVKGTLHSGDHVELKLITYAKVMPDKDYNNVLCVRPEDNPEEEDCVPAEITPTKGKPDIKKILDGNKYVTETGQTLRWKVTVTAKGGDVDLDKITDKFPKQYLSFTGYEFTGDWELEGITLQSFNANNTSGIATWDVTGTLLSGHKVELFVYTIVHTMPKSVLKNVACVKPADSEKEECSEATSYDLRIMKHILDKNGKKVKQITGNVGDKITYIIEFGNNGDEGATVSLKDYLPKSVRFISGTLIVNGTSKTGYVNSGYFSVAMMYSGSNEKIDGIDISKYEKIKLGSGQSGILTIEGRILEPKDEKYNKTNFACLFDENNNKIDCDDAHHEVEPNEFKCEKLEVTAGSIKRGGSTNVKCTASGGIADLITINCGNGTTITGADRSELLGRCEYKTSGKYSLQCTVEKDNKEYTSNSCNGSVTVEGSSSCFIAGTKVTMADGSKKNIEDVKIGEKVLGSNGTVNTVLGYDRPVLGIRHLWSINGSEYFVSDEHPFMTTEGWKSFNPEMTKLEVDLDTTKLKVGDILVTDNGLEKVKTVDYISADYNTPLYNFVLDGDHTYYANNYLVHNKGCTDCCTGPCCNGGCDSDPDPETYCGKEKNKNDPNCELAKPHCFNSNQGNFSIESGEYLPYYFNIFRDKTDLHQYVFKKESDSCILGEINLATMKCKIVIRDPENIEVYTREDIDCLTDESWVMDDSLIGKWAEAQNELYKIDVMKTERGRYWPTINYVQTIVDPKWKPSGNLGEYKFYVYLYQYDQCVENGDNSTIWTKYTYGKDKLLEEAPGCQSNFVLTEPYTVQKTPSGNLTASTDTLKKFMQVDGTAIKPFSSYLNAISTSEYHPNDTVNKAMDAFIDKYKKLAVNVDIKNSKFLSGTNVKKVPGKHIYFVDGDITVNGKNKNIDTPFTIVQTSGKTIINGDVGHNMMILTRGDIVFKGDCTSTQNVKGIFYAQGSLVRTGVLHNNDLNNKVWCTQGGLNIKGVLIGKNFNSLMRNSRSHLEYWFDVTGGKGGKNAKTIMNGGSVVIEYSPSIFTKSTMPPGAEEFTTALSIYKN